MRLRLQLRPKGGHGYRQVTRCDKGRVAAAERTAGYPAQRGLCAICHLAVEEVFAHMDLARIREEMIVHSID
jgi:hypothetical protein